jgi:hypothetical protein
MKITEPEIGALGTWLLRAVSAEEMRSERHGREQDPASFNVP